MYKSSEKIHSNIEYNRELYRRVLECAREESGRLELIEFTSADDAKDRAQFYIDQIGTFEREVLFKAIAETSVWLDCVEDLEKVFFLDIGIRPLVPILHTYRKKHNKPWPPNQFLPVGREMSFVTETERNNAVSQIQGIESGPIYLIDEFAYSGNTLAYTADAISKTFGLLPEEIHTHAITDVNTANGLFVTPRTDFPNVDGMQWEVHDISFRFPVQRIVDPETGIFKSIRVDAYTLPHTTERLLDLATTYMKKSHSTLDGDMYLSERTKQLNFDRIFYRSYVDALRQVVLSYDTED